MRLNSKREFLAAWSEGRLGNRPRMWRTWQEAEQSGAPQVGFRELGVPSGKHEVVPRGEIKATAERWSNRPYFVDEAAPDHAAVLQGEICRTFRGLEGFLGIRTGRRMRDSIAQGLLLPRTPLQTTLLIREFADPSSCDDIYTLLEMYPDATVEFTCYAFNVGIISGRNTLIWEVRDY